MKTLGTTTNGGHIVELTEQEHSMFARLIAASQGEEFAWAPFREVRTINANLENVFCLIGLWTDAKFRLNSLEQSLADIRGVLGAND